MADNDNWLTKVMNDLVNDPKVRETGTKALGEMLGIDLGGSDPAKPAKPTTLVGRLLALVNLGGSKPKPKIEGSSPTPVTEFAPDNSQQPSTLIGRLRKFRAAGLTFEQAMVVNLQGDITGVLNKFIEEHEFLVRAGIVKETEDSAAVAGRKLLNKIKGLET